MVRNLEIIPVHELTSNKLFCSCLIQACTNIWCSEEFRKDADGCWQHEIKKNEFANMLWSQLNDFIRNNRDTQTSAVPEAGSLVAGNKASAKEWPADELEQLILAKFPDASTRIIAAEKFVDTYMLERFREKEIDPGDAVDNMDDNGYHLESAKVLLAYVR